MVWHAARTVAPWAGLIKGQLAGDNYMKCNKRRATSILQPWAASRSIHPLSESPRRRRPHFRNLWALSQLLHQLQW